MLDDYAPKPAGERRGFPERGKVKISRDKRFLGGILGQTSIAQHRLGDTVGHVLAAFHDLGKRFLVTTLRRSNPITQRFY